MSATRTKEASAETAANRQPLISLLVVVTLVCFQIGTTQWMRQVAVDCQNAGKLTPDGQNSSSSSALLALSRWRMEKAFSYLFGDPSYDIQQDKKSDALQQQEHDLFAAVFTSSSPHAHRSCQSNQKRRVACAFMSTFLEPAVAQTQQQQQQQQLAQQQEDALLPFATGAATSSVMSWIITAWFTLSALLVPASTTNQQQLLGSSSSSSFGVGRRWAPLAIWCTFAHLLIEVSPALLVTCIVALMTQTTFFFAGNSENGATSRGGSSSSASSSPSSSSTTSTTLPLPLLVTRGTGIVLWSAMTMWVMPNPLLWLSVSFGLALDIVSKVSSLQMRRRVTFGISVLLCVAVMLVCILSRGTGENACLVSSSSSSASTTTMNVAQHVIHKARRYAIRIDVTHREQTWSPASLFAELLVYGFRNQAAACILFITALPWAVILVWAMRFKIKFESLFMLCVLCDHTILLGHFAIAMLLYMRSARHSSSSSSSSSSRQCGADDDDGGRRNGSAVPTLRLFLTYAGMITVMVSVSYFAAWGFYRSAQMNMSFYALFATHMLAAIWVLLDHEME